MKKEIYVGLVVALLWLCPSSAVSAQGRKAPTFEHVHSLAMDSRGQTLFLGAHTGLFRSDDRGRT
jgi:hypothetical protein